MRKGSRSTEGKECKELLPVDQGPTLHSFTSEVHCLCLSWTPGSQAGVELSSDSNICEKGSCVQWLWNFMQTIMIFWCFCRGVWTSNPFNLTRARTSPQASQRNASCQHGFEGRQRQPGCAESTSLYCWINKAYGQPCSTGGYWSKEKQ